MPKCQLLFSAVFGFRNPSKEIFSELDEINAQHPIFPRSFQNTREAPEGGHRGHHTIGRRGPGRAAPPYCVGAPSTLLTPPLRLFKASVDRKPSRRKKPRYEKPSRAAAIAKPRSGGQESLFRHAAGTGKCPRKASPSTPPPSSSPLLSPMRRE